MIPYKITSFHPCHILSWCVAYLHWFSLALFSLFQQDKRHEKFPPFFFSIVDKSCKENEKGRCIFFFRQMPGNQNKTASLHLRDHLYLKDLNSRGAIFEAPKVNVRRGHQTHRAVMHAQPAKSFSQHLISCVCYPLSFSLFHLLDYEWECIAIYQILRDFDGIQLHSFIHFKPSDIFG